MRGFFVEAHRGRWRVRTLAKVDGKSVKRTIGTYDSKDDAQMAADLCAVEVIKDVRKRGPKPNGSTILSVGETMLDEENASRQRRSVFQHIASDEIATMDPRLVGPPEVAAFRDRLEAKKVTRVMRRKEGSAWVRKGVALDRTLARQTVRNVLNLLATIFRYARQKGIASPNLLPTQQLIWTKVKRTKNAGHALKPKEVARLVAAIEGPEKYLFQFLAYTGLRAGEAASLHWVDVDMDGDEPHAWVRYGGPPSRDGSGANVWPPTKGGRPRCVPLLPMALEALRAWKRESPAWLADGGRKNELGIVFVRQNGGVREPMHLIKHEKWKAAKAKAKLPSDLRVHDLRHTMATSLARGWLGRRWSVEEVKEMLGHADTKTTERYFHAQEEMLSDAARETNKMNQATLAPETANGRQAEKVSPIYSPMGSETSRKPLKSLSRLGDLNPRPAVYEKLLQPNNLHNLDSLKSPPNAPFFPPWEGALEGVAILSVSLTTDGADEDAATVTADALARLVLVALRAHGDEGLADLRPLAEAVIEAKPAFRLPKALQLAETVLGLVEAARRSAGTSEEVAS